MRFSPEITEPSPRPLRPAAPVASNQAESPGPRCSCRKGRLQSHRCLDTRIQSIETWKDVSSTEKYEVQDHGVVTTHAELGWKVCRLLEADWLWAAGPDTLGRRDGPGHQCQ